MRARPAANNSGRDHALALGPARGRTAGEVCLHPPYQGAVGVRVEHADHHRQIAHARGGGLRRDPAEQLLAEQGQGVACQPGARRGIGIEKVVPCQTAEPQAIALLGLAHGLRRPAGREPAVIERSDWLPGRNPGCPIARRPVGNVQAQPLRRPGHGATPARLSAWARRPSTTSS
jgi:hypothetical protein